MKSPAPPAPRVPDHELLRPVGGGNYGVVWLGRSVLGSYRAVKVVHRSNFTAQRPYDREYAGLMKYEPLSRGHPGLVGVLHVGRNTAEEYFYCIMDLADDARHGRHIEPDHYQPRTLRSDLDQHQRLAVNPCVQTGLALASALGYLHRHGVVHRDVKPSNIIFVNHEPRFADIGLVEQIGETSTFVGSEGYTPPEGPGKPTADLYGLGKVLYEITLGLDQLRFPELPADFDQWPDATARRRLVELIRRACEMNPRRRFQTAEEMYQHLQRIIQEAPTESLDVTPPAAAAGPLRLVVIGDVQSGGLPQFTQLLETTLPEENTRVFVDQPSGTTIVRAQQIESEINQADAVLTLITPNSLDNEMLAYELQLAQSEAAQRGGRPCILPIIIGLGEADLDRAAQLVGSAQTRTWSAEFPPDDGLRHVRSMLRSLTHLVQSQPPLRLEAVGGAVPLDSAFYLERPADDTLHHAVQRGECIILIKGARQMGKTSLLARGLQRARESGVRVVHTDLQQLNAASFQTLESFYFALGNSLADALDLPNFPEDVWDSRRSPNRNLERYLKQEVLGRLTSQLAWGIDELDRLLPCEFGTEVFALMRSWYNNRALDPSGPWSRLSLLMALATEAHLIMPNLEQSPFNVGTRVTLEDFTPDQIAQLNRTHGLPLRRDDELQHYLELVGGQPYLVRRGLHEMVSRSMPFEVFQQEARKDDGIFADHLRRLVMLLARDTALVDALRPVLAGAPCPSQEAFHRLRASGVLLGTSPDTARPRCGLYRNYLQRALG